MFEFSAKNSLQRLITTSQEKAALFHLKTPHNSQLSDKCCCPWKCSHFPAHLSCVGQNLYFFCIWLIHLFVLRRDSPDFYSTLHIQSYVAFLLWKLLNWRNEWLTVRFSSYVVRENMLHNHTLFSFIFVAPLTGPYSIKSTEPYSGLRKQEFQARRKQFPPYYRDNHIQSHLWKKWEEDRT